MSGHGFNRAVSDAKSHGFSRCASVLPVFSGSKSPPDEPRTTSPILVPLVHFLGFARQLFAMPLLSSERAPMVAPFRSPARSIGRSIRFSTRPPPGRTEPQQRAGNLHRSRRKFRRHFLLRVVEQPPPIRPRRSAERHLDQIIILTNLLHGLRRARPVNPVRRQFRSVRRRRSYPDLRGAGILRAQTTPPTELHAESTPNQQQGQVLRGPCPCRSGSRGTRATWVSR